jgi:FkbM family methyltransferase
MLIATSITAVVEMAVSKATFPQKSRLNLQIKNLSQKLGLFPVTRALYQKVSPVHRRERLVNRRFYSEIVKAGDLCFDVGANVGQTIEALVDSDARVVAIEPNLNCLPVLKYQFQRNPDVTIVNKAVGSVAGVGELHFTGTESTASMREDWPFPNRGLLRVEMTTLDALIVEFGRPNFLKVDVEGFELEVFGGLSQPIPLIFFEMHAHELNIVDRIFERLSAIGEIAEVNAVSGDNSRWLMDSWVSHDRFLGKLVEPLPRNANVLVRMNG